MLLRAGSNLATYNPVSVGNKVVYVPACMLDLVLRPLNSGRLNVFPKLMLSSATRDSISSSVNLTDKFISTFSLPSIYSLYRNCLALWIDSHFSAWLIPGFSTALPLYLCPTLTSLSYLQNVCDIAVPEKLWEWTETTKTGWVILNSEANISQHLWSVTIIVCDIMLQAVVEHIFLTHCTVIVYNFLLSPLMSPLKLSYYKAVINWMFWLNLFTLTQYTCTHPKLHDVIERSKSHQELSNLTSYKYLARRSISYLEQSVNSHADGTLTHGYFIALCLLHKLCSKLSTDEVC